MDNVRFLQRLLFFVLGFVTLAQVFYLNLHGLIGAWEASHDDMHLHGADALKTHRFAGGVCGYLGA
jgi:hypothetical protein